MLLELHAKAFGAAAVDAGHDSLHHPARPEIEVRKSRKDEGVEVASLAVGHGLGIALRNLSTSTLTSFREVRTSFSVTPLSTTNG